MRSSELFILLLTCSCSFVFAQSSNSSILFVKQNENKVNIYKSNGFALPEFNDKNLKQEQNLFILPESNDIEYLSEEDLNLAHTHAKIKLDKAILSFDRDDIDRYTIFLNKILLRLKQLSGL